MRRLSQLLIATIVLVSTVVIGVIAWVKSNRGSEELSKPDSASPSGASPAAPNRHQTMP